MQTSKFTPAQFVDELKNNNFHQKFSIEGMIKLSEKDKNEILFNEGKKCGKWISIPIELIEEIEYLSTVECHDHNHPFVRLFFIHAEKNNAHAKIYLSLLEQLYPMGRESGVYQTPPSSSYSSYEYPSSPDQVEPFKMNDGGNSLCNCVSWQTVCVPKRRCHRIRTRNGWTTICRDYQSCEQYCAQMDCWDGSSPA